MVQEFRQDLRKLEREIGRELSEETECCSVTVSQCHLLLETEIREEASLQDMADTLALDKSTMSRTVDNLVRGKLIERSENGIDRRKVTLTLTPEGKKTCRKINALCNEHYASVFSHIPEDQYELVLRAVSLLAKAMEKTRIERGSRCCGR